MTKRRAAMKYYIMTETELHEKEDKTLQAQLVGKIIPISQEDRIMKDKKVLIVTDESVQKPLEYGTLEEVVQYLRDHEDLYRWILDNDPDFILPDFGRDYESWRELEADLDILDHSWWTLGIYDHPIWP